MAPPRIALISALRLSLDPITESFRRLWPEADRVHILDDSLSADRAIDGSLTESMIERFVELSRYAIKFARADAILFTCSAFGEAIETVAGMMDVPVLKPNEAMIDKAVALGRPVGLLATFAPTLDSMLGEFPVSLDVEPRLAVGALEAAEVGDFAEHDRLCAAAAQGFSSERVIALAQFSLARAAPEIARTTGATVLTTPDCAVSALRGKFGWNTDFSG